MVVPEPDTAPEFETEPEPDALPLPALSPLCVAPVSPAPDTGDRVAVTPCSPTLPETDVALPDVHVSVALIPVSAPVPAVSEYEPGVVWTLPDPTAPALALTPAPVPLAPAADSV